MDRLHPAKTNDTPSEEKSETKNKEMIPVKMEPLEEGVSSSAKNATEGSSCSISLAIDNVVGNYKDDTPDSRTPKTPANKTNHSHSKPTPKSSLKSNSKANKSSAKSVASKSTPKSSSNKSAAASRKQADDDVEDLDPAMYLDPTITITLINNDAEKKGDAKEAPSAGSISSSDLQVCIFL